LIIFDIRVVISISVTHLLSLLLIRGSDPYMDEQTDRWTHNDSIYLTSVALQGKNCKFILLYVCCGTHVESDSLQFDQDLCCKRIKSPQATIQYRRSIYCLTTASAILI